VGDRYRNRGLVSGIGALLFVAAIGAAVVGLWIDPAFLAAAAICFVGGCVISGIDALERRDSDRYRGR
jgi:hypothetical protein